MEKLACGESTSSGKDNRESEGGDADIVEEEEDYIVRDTDSCRSGSPTPASQLSNVILTQRRELRELQLSIKKCYSKCTALA